MFKNYLKTALRNLQRYKMLSFVNIAGLAIGLASVMLILLFINDEYSFDKFEQNGNRLYRLVQKITDTSGQESRRGNTGISQGPVFAKEIPEIESFCRIKGWPMLVKKGSEAIEEQVVFADTSFFNMFTAPVLQGNHKQLLSGRNSAVITDEMAAKYFGKANPVGKLMEVEVDTGFESFLVTAVVKHMPANSSIRFDVLIPFERTMDTDPQQRTADENDWMSSYLNTFFLMKPNTSIANTGKKIWQSFLAHNPNWEEVRKNNGVVSWQLILQPFLFMHLDPDYYATNGLTGWSNSKYSYILSGLAILILLIACINFINITIAKSLQRSKEIGVRKVAGSSRKQIIIQFLGEAFVVTLLSFIPAFFFVDWMLPLFSNLSDKSFDISYLFQPSALLLFGTLLIVVTLLAGFYPALVISRFKPVQTLYGQARLSGKNWLVKSLVLFQFVMAVTLIICTIVFNTQLNYMTKSDLGFKKENIIRVEFPWGKSNDDIRRFKQTLLSDASIENIGAKSGDWNKTIFFIKDKKTDFTYYEIIDDQYLQLLQIPLVKGRYLSYGNIADTATSLGYCLVNETFVKTHLDPSQDAIGQVIGRNNNTQTYRVAGVVKDYFNANFREKIEPLFFCLDKRGQAFNVFIKYKPGKGGSAISAIQKDFHAILPFDKLNYQFMQDWNESWYSDDIRWKKMVFFTAAIAIFISCMGLFALTALSTQQRVKEIGIRKVLGATVANITTLVSRDFILLVVFAILIASPLAAWLMNKWLQEFAYRIELSWWIFATAGLLAVLIALITVSFQSIKAAIANPVKSLRTE